MNLEFKQLINIDEDTLNIISNWMYNWWGKNDGYSFEKVKCFMKEGDIIGMYQFLYEDLNVRPDIYPWLANVYVDENYRKQGYGRILLENVKKVAQENIDFEEIFLYTKHMGLYEKFGWTYLYDIDTYNENQRIERLYKLKLR